MPLPQCPPFHVHSPGGYACAVALCIEEQLQVSQCLQNYGCQIVDERVPRAVVRRRQCMDAGGAFDSKIAVREGAQEEGFVESLASCVPQFNVRGLERFVPCFIGRRQSRRRPRRSRVVGGGSARRFDAPEPREGNLRRGRSIFPLYCVHRTVFVGRYAHYPRPVSRLCEGRLACSNKVAYPCRDGDG